MRILLSNLGLLVCATILGLTIAEITLQLFFSPPLVQSSGQIGFIQRIDVTPQGGDRVKPYAIERFYIRTPNGYRHAPNSVLNLELSDGRSISVRTNELGLRHRPLAEIPPDRKRLLVLGDSVTYGGDHNRENTFVGLLNDQTSGWEIINGAVSGFGVQDSLNLFEEVKPAVRPNAVLLMLFLNDAVPSPTIDLWLPPRWLSRIQLAQHLSVIYSQARHQLKGDSRRVELMNKAKEWSAGASSRLTVLPEPFRTKALNAIGDWGLSWSAEVQGFYAEALSKFAELSRASCIEPLVAILPASPQVTINGADDFPQRALLASSLELKLPALDLLPALRGLPPGEQRKLYVDDAHLTAFGHKAVAAIIQPWLETHTASLPKGIQGCLDNERNSQT